LGAERDDQTVTSGAALTGAAETEFEQAAAKIGVDKTTLSSFDSVDKVIVGYPLLSCEPREPLRLVDLQ
jgi:hypothetical protein